MHWSQDVPINALHSCGYISIGCEPCTRAVLPNQHEREGRWWWEVGHFACFPLARNVLISNYAEGLDAIYWLLIMGWGIIARLSSESSVLSLPCLHANVKDNVCLLRSYVPFYLF